MGTLVVALILAVLLFFPLFFLVRSRCLFCGLIKEIVEDIRSSPIVLILLTMVVSILISYFLVRGEM